MGSASPPDTSGGPGAPPNILPAHRRSGGSVWGTHSKHTIPQLPPTRPAPHHQFLLGHQPSNPVSALGGLLADPGQLPSVLNNGALKTLAATRETPPVGTRPLATSSAAPPWPRVGARNFPGGETTIRRERREPAWSPGWGDGGGRPLQAASGSGPCPGLTLAGGNRLRVRRFRMKP